jgi:hypothetical protein
MSFQTGRHSRVRRLAPSVGRHQLNMLLQDVGLDRSFDHCQRMVGRHDRDQVDGQQGKASETAMSLKMRGSKPITQAPSSTISAAAPRGWT